MGQTTLAIALLFALGCSNNTGFSDPAGGSADQLAASGKDHDDRNDDRPRRFRLAEGRHIFRFDTFGDEDFWGGTLRLHQAIEGSAHGGVGPGVSPKTALAVGLKVDVDALPKATIDALNAGKVDLTDPGVTIALLTSNAVVGVTGFSDGTGGLKSIGIQCALCHSTVDNSLAPGIGHRLDGWPNRDLNVGAIVGLSPNLQPVADLLGVSVDTVQKVLASWGPGKFDAELFLDGKAFQPDGKTSAATLIPAAFGLAGVNLHTYRRDQVPRRGARRFRARESRPRPGHLQARSPARLPVEPPGSAAAGGQLRRESRGAGAEAIRRQGQLRTVPRCASLH